MTRHTRLSVVILALRYAAVALAQEELPQPRALEPAVAAPADACCCPPVEEKPYHFKKIRLVENQEVKLVPNVAAVEAIGTIPYCDLAVEYREEKRTVTVMALKPRVEERLVHTMTLVPHKTVDPCTGCTKVEYATCPICKMVKVQVFDQVPEQREITVKVPVLRPVEKELQVRSFVLNKAPQPKVFRSFEALVLPTEGTLHVPPCPQPREAELPADEPVRPEPGVPVGPEEAPLPRPTRLP